MLRHVGFTYAFSAIYLLVAGWWGFYEHGLAGLGKALFLTFTLALMEISLSFDKAVVNASILRHWDAFWGRLFLTLGILIAVFGMRLLFPLLIVAMTANMSLIEVFELALYDPNAYAHKLTEHHAPIATFGGTFLLMVFANFFFEHNKREHWLNFLEKPMQTISANASVATLFSLITLLIAMQYLAPVSDQTTILLTGIWGLVVYLVMYLEHGAHYAIGALAIIMLLSIQWHIPKIFTGTIGILCIGTALWASIQRNRYKETM